MTAVRPARVSYSSDWAAIMAKSSADGGIFVCARAPEASASAAAAASKILVMIMTCLPPLRLTLAAAGAIDVSGGEATVVLGQANVDAGQLGRLPGSAQ